MSNKRLYENNAKTTLASTLFVEDTSITVVDGSRFPQPTDGDYFLITVDAGVSKEIIKVFTRVGNSFQNVERAQENTTPSIFSVGVRVENRDTAGTLNSFARKEDRLGDIDSVDDIPKPATVDGNSYLTATVDDGGTPIIAVKNGDKWSFLSHSIRVATSTITSDSSTTSLTSNNIGLSLGTFSDGKYIVQFKSGPNAGLSRLVTAFGASTISWDGPLTPNLYGVEFDIYQSSFSALQEAGSGSGATIDPVLKPTNVSPASQTSSAGVTPTLVGSPFYSLYSKAQTAAQFQVSPNIDFSSIAADSGTISAATSWTVINPLTSNTAYYWRARYRDADNFWSSFSDATGFSTGSVVIATPSILSPVSGSTGVPVNVPVVSSPFSIVGGTDTHVSSDWQVWTGPNGTGVKVFESLGNTTNKTSITVTSGITALATYYVRVRYNGSVYGTSGWAGSVQFSTSGLIVRPTISAPANGATDVVESPTLIGSIFSVSGSTDTHYSSDWQAWTGPNGTGTKIWELVDSTTSKTSAVIPPGVLSVSTTYYPRVRYKGATLPASDWSVGNGFTTASTFFQGLSGEAYEGGLYVGPYLDLGVTYALIVTTADGDQESTGSTAANKCANLSLNGYSDWFLPPVNQLEMIYRVLKPGTIINNRLAGANTTSLPPRGVYTALLPMQTEVSTFKTGGAYAMLTDDATVSSGYWASGPIAGYPISQPAGTTSIQNFSTGLQTYVASDTVRRVRATRRIPHPNIVIRPTVDSFSWAGATTIVSSSYAYVGSENGAHTSTDWQVWTGPNATGSLAYQSLNDVTNKVSVIVPSGALTVSTTYYPRVRHRSSTGSISAWSRDLPIKTLPTVVGTAFAGGYYAGRIVQGTSVYALVISPKASGENTSVAWKTSNTASSSVGSVIDGYANSQSVNNVDHPAMFWARGLTIGGFNDWYIPAMHELFLVYKSFKPSPNNNEILAPGEIPEADPVVPAFTASIPPITTVPAFVLGGSEAFTEDLYWTSTEQDASTAIIIVMDRAGTFSGTKNLAHKARAIRRVLIS